MTTVFQQEWLNEPQPISDKETELMKLAEQYHQRCERFDRVVCTGRRKGVAIPADGHERRLITVNAMQIRKELGLIAYSSLGATPKEWQSAIFTMGRVFERSLRGQKETA